MPRFARHSQWRNAESERALAVLLQKPGDPAASAKVGAFRCFVKGDWTSGLPLLADGGDAVVRAAARRELATGAAPAGTDGLIAVGDGWWDAAQRESGVIKAAALRRSGFWYRRTLGALDKGLARTKMERRLRAIDGATGTTPSAAASSLSGSKPGLVIGLNDLPRYAALRVVPGWERLAVRTTLASQTVSGPVTLDPRGSPYLVSGFLDVERSGTLTIEPGVVVLFGPGVAVTCKGHIAIGSDGPWAVLAGSDRLRKWKGIVGVGGTVTARRCLAVGAEAAFSTERADDGLAVRECVFAGNGKAIVSGPHGWATAEDCLFVRNGSGLASTSDGFVTFSRCLAVANTVGFDCDYNGGCKGSDSTFYANETGLHGGLYDGDRPLQLRGCNVVGNTVAQAAAAGQRVDARGNFWGKGLGAAVAGGRAPLVKGDKLEAFDWTETPFEAALPSLPPCDYLQL